MNLENYLDCFVVLFHDSCVIIYYISLFYTDCIGSAFNMKGAMQCPNCRNIEKGQWLYASGSTFPFPESSVDVRTPDEDTYELSYSEMVSTTLVLTVSFSF